MSDWTRGNGFHLRRDHLFGLLFLCAGLLESAAFAEQPPSAVPPPVEAVQQAAFPALVSRLTPAEDSGEKLAHRIAGLELLDVPWFPAQALSDSPTPKPTVLQTQLPVKETLRKSGRPLRWVSVRGIYKPNSADTKLICNYTYDRQHRSPQIKIDVENRFSVSVPIQGDQMLFDLTAVDSQGLVAREEFRIDCPGCVSPLKAAPAPPPPRWGFTPAVGLTQLSYTETRVSRPVDPYSAIMLTPKLGVSFELTDQWSLGANAFINAVSLTSSDPSLAVRFLGLNARLGYSLPSSTPSSWKTMFMLGAYSLGMSVNTNTLGFDRLYGPQIVLAERKTFGLNNALSGYIKYSALITGSEVSLSQRELAGGLSYERKIGSQRYSASFDASQFDFSIGTVQIQSRALTLGLGMNL